MIAILGEFDALPGLSQQTVPERAPVTPGGSGHACGHNLLGSGAALAAVAVKQYMEANHIGGTLRYYGTPAEEGGDGKVYMVRAGLFKDVDVVLHWHPADRNEVTNGGMLAITGAKFTFHGVAAHAAMAPDRGRSALDAVMLMGTGIEYMREHVPSNTRIHYIITKGGVAPNIVPDLAQIDLIARHPSSATLQQIWSRLLDIAKGAALMTGTTYEVTDISGDANIVSNDALGALVQKNLEEVGGYTMSETERTFAVDLQKTLNIDSPPSLDQTHEVEPLRRPDPNAPAASTDVGDVSWVVPTIGFTTATFVPGVAPHTWQAASSAGMSIGQDGMVVASKVIAMTAVDLFTNSQLLALPRRILPGSLPAGNIIRSFLKDKNLRSTTGIEPLLFIDSRRAFGDSGQYQATEVEQDFHPETDSFHIGGHSPGTLFASDKRRAARAKLWSTSQQTPPRACIVLPPG